MTAILVCTDQDVIDRFGGQDQLNQALDPNKTGTYDATTLLKARQDASADVESYVGERMVVWGASSFPQKIIRLAASLAVYYVWQYATGGQAIPDGIRKLKEDCVNELEKIGQGKAGTGTPTPPARFAGRGGVDMSQGGVKVCTATMRFSGGILGGR